jgi:hypothetical protein
MSTDVFRHRLEEWLQALDTDSFKDPDEFAHQSVEFGKELSATATRYMLAQHAKGVSEFELLAAFPLALAFVVNGLVFCINTPDRVLTAERLLKTTLDAAVQAGNTDANQVPSMTLRRAN